MEKYERILRKIAEVYQRKERDAEEYLTKARRLKKEIGLSFAIVYCWFFSIPQKWTQVEPKIFELSRYTNSFDLNSMLFMNSKRIAQILKPIIFYNQISMHLKNFCKVIHDEYRSWENFSNSLEKETIFTIFKRIRRNKSSRVTFKNLAAMKIFVGMNNDLFILDTHVAKVLGLSKHEQTKINVQRRLFEKMLMFSEKITYDLREMGFNEVTTAKWSLAIWFNGAKISANDLLKENKFKSYATPLS